MSSYMSAVNRPSKLMKCSYNFDRLNFSLTLQSLFNMIFFMIETHCYSLLTPLCVALLLCGQQVCWYDIVRRCRPIITIHIETRLFAPITKVIVTVSRGPLRLIGKSTPYMLQLEISLGLLRKLSFVTSSSITSSDLLNRTTNNRLQLPLKRVLWLLVDH